MSEPARQNNLAVQAQVNEVEAEADHNENLVLAQSMEQDASNQPDQQLSPDNQQQSDEWLFQNNIQIGMVRTFTFNSSPVDLSLAGKHLKEKAQLSPSEHELLAVPKEWANFLKGLLLSPAHYNWAKKILQMGLPDLLSTGPQNDCMISLKKQINPNACNLLADEPRLTAQLEEALPAEDYEEPILSKKRGRKTKISTPIVESAVRRSARIQAHTKGFKSDSCTKNCLACSSEPPTLSTSAIKKIGATLCQLSESEMEDLSSSGKKSLGPIGKKTKKNTKDKANDDNKDESNQDNEHQG